MLEPPSLADSTILAALRAHYGIASAVLTFLPIGNDSASFVYRVEAANGASYFLKERSGAGFSAGFVDMFEPAKIVEIALAS